MRWLKRIALAGYGLLALAVYIGFLVRESEHPLIFRYSGAYLVILALLLLLLGLPFILLLVRRRIGPKVFLYVSIPTLVFIVLVYFGFAAYYYQTQRHPFDPFLQAPPQRFEEENPSPPGDSYRILAIGGSTTANFHLPREERYPTLLGEILQERHPESGIQVFNAGQDWWTTKHSLINYVTYARDWEPDLVVIMHAINDLYRSFSPRFYAVGEYDPLWSHFYGPSVFGANPPSYLGHLRNRYLRPLLWRWYPKQRYIEMDYPVDRYVSIEPFEENLRKLIHFIRSDGVDVILLTEPSILKDEMTREERNILKFGFSFCITSVNWWKSEYPSPRSLGEAMDAFNDVIRRVGREENVPVVELAQAIPKTLDHFTDDVHYTPKGSRLVAGLIADAIDGLGSLSRSEAGD